MQATLGNDDRRGAGEDQPGEVVPQLQDLPGQVRNPLPDADGGLRPQRRVLPLPVVRRLTLLILRASDRPGTGGQEVPLHHPVPSLVGQHADHFVAPQTGKATPSLSVLKYQYIRALISIPILTLIQKLFIDPQNFP